MSFPFNCGRALYSTYHAVGGTHGGRHAGLIGQELMIFYMLMEMTTCPEIPIVK